MDYRVESTRVSRFGRVELSNQESGLGEVLQVCILTDKPSPRMFWPIGS